MGKKNQQTEQQQPKRRGTSFPRRTKSSTVKNVERRRKTHQNWVAKKQRHLEKRCALLAEKLEKTGRTCERGDRTLGRYHKNLSRMLNADLQGRRRKKRDARKKEQASA